MSLNFQSNCLFMILAYHAMTKEVLLVCCDAVMAVAVVCIAGKNTYSCDFERYGECGWEQSVDDSSDWTVRSAAISSNGPEVDHTFNATAGLYITTASQ